MDLEQTYVQIREDLISAISAAVKVGDFEGAKAATEVYNLLFKS